MRRIDRRRSRPRSSAPILCGLLVAAAACSGGGQASAGGIEVSEMDSAGVTLVAISGDVSDLPVWTLAEVPEAEIGGTSPPYLGRIGEVAFLADGRLLVEDNQTDELRLFDADGDFVRLVGGAGEGPGEFRNLTELNVTSGDTAYAYDRRLYRVSVFDGDGDLIEAIGLTREDGGYGTLAMDAWGLSSEHLVLHRLGPYDTLNSATRPRRDQRDAVLSVLDGDGATRFGPIRFRGGYSIDVEHGDVGAPFANRPVIAVGASKIVHGSGVTYELTVSGPDLRPRRIIRWSRWQEPLTEEEVRAARDTAEARMAEFLAQRPQLARSLLDARFSPDLLPEMRPALGRVLIDHGGRLWVSRFEPTTKQWSEEDVWHVLDPAGHPLARVRLPPDARLAAVRQDRVALVARDSLDVQHLRVFALREERVAR